MDTPCSTLTLMHITSSCQTFEAAVYSYDVYKLDNQLLCICRWITFRDCCSLVSFAAMMSRDWFGYHYCNDLSWLLMVSLLQWCMVTGAGIIATMMYRDRWWYHCSNSLMTHCILHTNSSLATIMFWVEDSLFWRHSPSSYCCHCRYRLLRPWMIASAAYM